MSSIQAITLRAKKLGVLVKDARTDAGKSKKEAGIAIGASSSTINSIESGRKSPSLPQLELLAYFLNVPLEHFWTDEIRSSAPSLLDTIHVEHALTLRDRFIGSIIHQAREKLTLTYKDVRDKTGITAGRMKKYESGEGSIPIPELELLSNLLEISLSTFTDPEAGIGRWVLEQRSVQDFLKLPLDIQTFVCKPVNKPYLELAQKLSRLNTEELRSLAEGLLEITI